MLDAHAVHPTQNAHGNHDSGPASGHRLAPLVPVTARGEATRQRLLRAAEEEFAVRGFHVASVSSVTSRAGVGQGTFYLYFRTKEEIFVTLVRDIGHKLQEHMQAALAAEPARAAQAAMQVFVDFVCADAGLYRIVQEAQFVDVSVFREFHERVARDFGGALATRDRHDGPAVATTEVLAWALLGIGQAMGMKSAGGGQSAVPARASIEALVGRLLASRSQEPTR